MNEENNQARVRLGLLEAEPSPIRASLPLGAVDLLSTVEAPACSCQSHGDQQDNDDECDHSRFPFVLSESGENQAPAIYSVVPGSFTRVYVVLLYSVSGRTGVHIV